MIDDKPLTPQARNWLRRRDAQLKQQAVVTEKVSGKVMKQVLTWCQAHELIAMNSLQLPVFSWSRELLDLIELTQHQLRETSFREQQELQTRTDSSKGSDQEDKSIGIQPREYQVLIRLPQPVVQSALTVQFVDIDFHLIDLTRYQQLLVVENLDCFYALEQFSTAITLERALVIYRGDFAYGKGATALKERWLQTGKPLCYFGDFDLKGVSIALLEGYSTMLLPEFKQLTEVASAAQQPTEQLNYEKGIRASSVSPSFQSYQALILSYMGLRQQKMTEMQLVQVVL